MKMEFKQKVISGIGWNFGAQILKQTIQFGLLVLLARLLSPEDFGIIGMIVIFTGFATLLGDFGFGDALIQRKDVSEAHYYSIFWLNFGTGL